MSKKGLLSNDDTRETDDKNSTAMSTSTWMSGRPYDKFFQVDRVDRPPTDLEQLSRTKKRKILKYALKHGLKPFVKYHVPMWLIRKSIKEISAEVHLDYEHWSEKRITKFKNKFHRYAMSYGYTINKFEDKVIRREDKFYIRRAIFNGRVNKPQKDQEIAVQYFHQIVPDFKPTPKRKTTANQFSAKNRCEAARISFSATTSQDSVSVNTNVSQSTESTPTTASSSSHLKPSTSAPSLYPTNSRKNNSPTFVVKRKPLYFKPTQLRRSPRGNTPVQLSPQKQRKHSPNCTNDENPYPEKENKPPVRRRICLSFGSESANSSHSHRSCNIQRLAPRSKDRILKTSNQLLSLPLPPQRLTGSTRSISLPKMYSQTQYQSMVGEAKSKQLRVSLIQYQPPFVPEPTTRILKPSTQLLSSNNSSSTLKSHGHMPNKPADQPIPPQPSKRGRGRPRKCSPKRSPVTPVKQLTPTPYRTSTSCTTLETTQRFPIVSLIQYKPPSPFVPKPKNRILKPSTQLLSSNNSSRTLKSQGRVSNKPASQPISSQHSKHGRPKKRIPKRSSGKRLPPCRLSFTHTSPESKENVPASSTTSLTNEEEVFDYDDPSELTTLLDLVAVGNFVSMYGPFGDDSDSEEDPIAFKMMEEKYPELHEPGFNLLEWLYKD